MRLTRSGRDRDRLSLLSVCRKLTCPCCAQRRPVVSDTALPACPCLSADDILDFGMSAGLGVLLLFVHLLVQAAATLVGQGSFLWPWSAETSTEKKNVCLTDFRAYMLGMDSCSNSWCAHAVISLWTLAMSGKMEIRDTAHLALCHYRSVYLTVRYPAQHAGPCRARTA